MSQSTSRECGRELPTVAMTFQKDQRRRYPRSFANLKHAFELADEAVLYDNSTDAGHVEVAVKGKRGIHFSEPLPDWATVLRD
jgi:predicted ABC-type ATPase